MASAFFANGTSGPSGTHHGMDGHLHRGGTPSFYGHTTGLSGLNGLNGLNGVHSHSSHPFSNGLNGASSSAGVNGSSNGHRPPTNGFANGGHDSPSPFPSRNHSPPSSFHNGSRSPSHGFPNGNNHSPPLSFPSSMRVSPNGYSNGNPSPSSGFGNVSLPPLHSFFQGTNGHGVNGVNGMNSVKTVAGTTEPTGIGSIDRLKYLVDEVGKGVETLSGGNPKPLEDIAKLKLVTATQELLGTVRPPQDAIMGWFAYMGIVSAVHVFQDWNVFDAIPPTGRISYAELAEKVHAEEAVLCKWRQIKKIPCGWSSASKGESLSNLPILTLTGSDQEQKEKSKG